MEISGTSKFESSCPLCKSTINITIKQLADEETINCSSCKGTIHLRDIDGKAKELLDNIRTGVFNPSSSSFKAETITAINKGVDFNSIHPTQAAPSSSTKPIISPVTCPYCGINMLKVPQRKTKCPSCGRYIYVRTRPSDRQRVLTTEEGAKRIDAEWTVNNGLNSFNINDKEFRDTETAITEKFKSPASRRDVIWAILNNRLLSTIKTNNWQEMKSIYFEQALLIKSEGRDPFRLLQESRRCELRAYQNNGVKKVDILTAGESSCTRCRELDQKRFTIDEALVTMPIPIKDCNSPWGYCRCIYLAVIE